MNRGCLVSLLGPWGLEWCLTLEDTQKHQVDAGMTGWVPEGCEKSQGPGFEVSPVTELLHGKDRPLPFSPEPHPGSYPPIWKREGWAASVVLKYLKDSGNFCNAAHCPPEPRCRPAAAPQTHPTLAKAERDAQVGFAMGNHAMPHKHLAISNHREDSQGGHWSRGDVEGWSMTRTSAPRTLEASEQV